MTELDEDPFSDPVDLDDITACGGADEDDVGQGLALARASPSERGRGRRAVRPCFTPGVDAGAPDERASVGRDEVRGDIRRLALAVEAAACRQPVRVEVADEDLHGGDRVHR